MEGCRAGERERLSRSRGALEEERIERGKDDARLFLTLPTLSQNDGLPSKRPAGIERC